MNNSRTIRLAVLLGVASITPGAVAADAPPKGDRWEITSQMSMEGMPMKLPANKVKVCSPKDWKEAPGSADERRKCVNSDFHMDGNKATWKVVCAGPPAMTGDGELTRESDDAWAGTIKFTSADGSMTLTLAGQKLGECENPR